MDTSPSWSELLTEIRVAALCLVNAVTGEVGIAVGNMSGLAYQAVSGATL